MEHDRHGSSRAAAAASASSAAECPRPLATFETATGVVVYDRDDPRAWLEGDSPVSLEDIR